MSAWFVGYLSEFPFLLTVFFTLTIKTDVADFVTKLSTTPVSI